ncbi:hypothetical protein D3C71_1805400 [compost metagenome]
MVADETVDAEDQHAGATRGATGFSAAQHGTVHQAQFVGQLWAAQVQTVVVALAGVDDQRVLTAGDAQRVDADDAARRQAFVALGDFGAPDNQLVLAHRAEGARVRLGNGTDQVEQFFGRPGPGEFAVGRSATAE